MSPPSTVAAEAQRKVSRKKGPRPKHRYVGLPVKGVDCDFSLVDEIRASRKCGRRSHVAIAFFVCPSELGPSVILNTVKTYGLVFASINEFLRDKATFRRIIVFFAEHTTITACLSSGIWYSRR